MNTCGEFAASSGSTGNGGRRGGSDVAEVIAKGAERLGLDIGPVEGAALEDIKPNCSVRGVLPNSIVATRG
jgi:hypothetical protein